MPLAAQTPVSFITTKDREVAQHFYGEVLQLPFLRDDGFAAVYDLAGVPLRITQIPGYAASGYPVLGWYVPDIVATVTALVERGVVMTFYDGLGQDALGIWTAPDGAAKVAFFSDPDGNCLSVAQPA